MGLAVERGVGVAAAESVGAPLAVGRVLGEEPADVEAEKVDAAEGEGGAENVGRPVPVTVPLPVAARPVALALVLGHAETLVEDSGLALGKPVGLPTRALAEAAPPVRVGCTERLGAAEGLV